MRELLRELTPVSLALRLVLAMVFVGLHGAGRASMSALCWPFC